MDLMTFCWPDEDTRTPLQKPFSRNGYTYASDGSIIVRVPQVPEWPQDTGPITQWNDEYFKFDPGFREDAILNIPIRWEYETCDEKDCLESPSMYCRFCRGTGYVLKSKIITQHNGFKLNQIYVDKIRSLKDLKTYFPDVNCPKIQKDSCFFEFDGGCGLVMGMR